MPVQAVETAGNAVVEVPEAPHPDRSPAQTHCDAKFWQLELLAPNKLLVLL